MSSSSGGKSTPSGWDHHGNKVIAGLALALLAFGTVFYRVLEGWEWVDSLYFCTVALTTVGFGDLTPTTSGSKLFTIFYVLGGIALITTYLNLLGRRFVGRAKNRMDSQSGS